MNYEDSFMRGSYCVLHKSPQYSMEQRTVLYTSPEARRLPGGGGGPQQTNNIPVLGQNVMPEHTYTCFRDHIHHRGGGGGVPRQANNIPVPGPQLCSLCM